MNAKKAGERGVSAKNVKKVTEVSWMWAETWSENRC